MSDGIYLRCDCSAETMDFDLFVEDEDDGYVTFSSYWNQHRKWSERLKAAWTILRGNEHRFAEIILKGKEVEQLREYLATPPTGT